ncbi:MAG: NTP transferase domain-containing protein [Candidatus Atribacteria bacterium]|nr:NTP transferase domain-containing protein [Candidatus Atribacteria bacterium]
MKCLIIAAGEGSRLSNRGDSKPLIPLLGIPLIERVILNVNKVGLRDFYIVSGYNGEKVRKHLDQFSQNRDITITHLINEEWEKQNGLSVLKAKGHIRENFILLMTDHIFDENILARLMETENDDSEVRLAVDYNIDNKMVDIEDVTKVLVDGNDRIVNIGKNIEEYNAYDTGIFHCSPAIFEALEESVANGDISLSGGMKILDKSKKARTFDIKEKYWIDVDDEKAFKKAENTLLNNLKKTSDGPVSRYLNRPISTRISKYLTKKRITPNQISSFSFSLSMIGAFFFFLGGYVNLLIGGMLAQVSSVIDGCDGEIARLKFQTSEFGGWFDAVLDRYADAFLLFGLTCYAYLPSKNFLYLLVGFLAIIGAFMNSYTADKYDGLMKKKVVPGKHYFRMGRDVRMFIIFLGALINQPLLVLFVIAILMNVENIRRIIIFYKNG